MKRIVFLMLVSLKPICIQWNEFLKKKFVLHVTQGLIFHLLSSS